MWKQYVLWQLVLALFIPFGINTACADQVSQSLREIQNDSIILYNQIDTLRKTYQGGEKLIIRDSRSGLNAPWYQQILKSLIETTQTHSSKKIGSVAKMPLELTEVAKTLHSKWYWRHDNQYGITVSKLAEAFSKLHQAYWQTIVITYVYIDYLRQCYLDYDSPNYRGPQKPDEDAPEYAKSNFEKSEKKRKDSLINLMRPLHQSAQRLIKKMGSIRTDDAFNIFSPNAYWREYFTWETVYGPIFYVKAPKDSDEEDDTEKEETEEEGFTSLEVVLTVTKDEASANRKVSRYFYPSLYPVMPNNLELTNLNGSLDITDKETRLGIAAIEAWADDIEDADQKERIQKILKEIRGAERIEAPAPESDPPARPARPDETEEKKFPPLVG